MSSREFSKLDYYLYTRQRRYVNWTHPKKSLRWKQRRYWGKLNLRRNDNWVFGDKKTGAYMLKFSWFNISRHVLVKGRSSPDDPQLRDYWGKRRWNKQRTEAEQFNRIQQKAAQKQGYRDTSVLYVESQYSTTNPYTYITSSLDVLEAKMKSQT